MKQIARVGLLCLVIWAAGIVGAAAQNRDVIYGIDPQYGPFTFTNNGFPAGFEVELLEAVLKGRDVTLIIRFMNWDDMLKDLAAGRIHVVSGVSRNPEREKLFDFSTQPSSTDTASIFVNFEDEIHSLAGLEGYKVSCQKGTIFEDMLGPYPQVEKRTYATDVDALKALAYREVDAYLGNAKPANFNIRRYGFRGDRGYYIKEVTPPLTRDNSYFAVRKGDQALLDMINQGQAQIARDGTFEAIYKKWFVDQSYF